LCLTSELRDAQTGVTPTKSERHQESNLRAALGFLQIHPRARELRLLHRWLDSSSGIGLLAVGMYRQGYRLSLSHIAEGEWRATFQANPMFGPVGFGVAATPWRAVQDAAWRAIKRSQQ
jgi:hypothetical protein